METKPWWQSKAMVGTIVALACMVLKAFGKDINLPQDAVTDNAITILGALSGIVSIYGTATRTTTITAK